MHVSYDIQFVTLRMDCRHIIVFMKEPILATTVVLARDGRMKVVVYVLT
jgi:hypothetical protein